jgi:hypothetical protein
MVTRTTHQDCLRKTESAKALRHKAKISKLNKLNSTAQHIKQRDKEKISKLNT